MNKLDLIKEVLDNWEKGLLSNRGAIVAIEIIVYPKGKSTKVNNAIGCTCIAQANTPGPWHEANCDMWSTVEGEEE